MDYMRRAGMLLVLGACMLVAMAARQDVRFTGIDDWAKTHGFKEASKPKPWWIKNNPVLICKSFKRGDVTVMLVGGRFASPESRKEGVEYRWRSTAAGRVKTPFPSLEKKGIVVSYVGVQTNLVAVLEKGNEAVEVLMGHDVPNPTVDVEAFRREFESLVDEVAKRIPVSPPK